MQGHLAQKHSLRSVVPAELLLPAAARMNLKSACLICIDAEVAVKKPLCVVAAQRINWRKAVSCCGPAADRRCSA